MKFDPMQIFFFLLRAIPVILVIVLIIYAFFAFKIEVRTEEMERLNIELAENILVSDMTVVKSVFNARKLIEIENQDPDNHNMQPMHVCGYGYYLNIEGKEEKYCENDIDCKFFCMNACGFSESEAKKGENYKCAKGIVKNLFGNVACQCKCPNKNDNKWFERYNFYFGYEAGDTKIRDGVSRTYPVGIYESSEHGFYRSTVSPATMTITVYDSWLTRIACMAEKAYDMKEIQRLPVYDFSKFGFVKDCFVAAEYKCISAKEFDNHLCIYKAKDEKFEPEECIYSETPNIIPFFTVYRYKGFDNATLVAYPIKESALHYLKTGSPNFYPKHVCLDYDSDTNCVRINNNPNYIAKEPTDTIGAVIFCLETKEGGKPKPIPGQLDCV